MDWQSLAYKLGHCSDTGLPLKEWSLLFHNDLPADCAVVLLDLGNLHGANHLWTMAGSNRRIAAFVNQLRHTELMARFGGDEFVLVVPLKDLDGFTARVAELLYQNDLYGAMAVVRGADKLTEAFERADAIVSSVKAWLEAVGWKARREDKYTVKQTITVKEEGL